MTGYTKQQRSRRYLGGFVAFILLAAICANVAADEHHVYSPGSIQDAIDSASDGDVVVVHPGEYWQTFDFLGKAITVRSTDPADPDVVFSTVVTGFLDLGPTVTCSSGEGPDTVLSGLRIAYGSKADYGSGMFNSFSSPTVTYCVFMNNTADLVGGGMYNEWGDPTVSHCTFVSNEAGAGGGMCNWISSPALTNCVFIANAAESGGGIWSHHHSSKLINCTFIRNSAGEYGGAMCNNDWCSASLINCTVSDNEAGHGGAVANLWEARVKLANCILWGNGQDQIYHSDGYWPYVTYSCVEGCEGQPWAGEGCIDADPLFVDPDNDDFRLSAGSPCIDAGFNNKVPIDSSDMDANGLTCERFPIDLDGNPRFADDPGTEDAGCGVPVVVDMGAYEFAGDPAVVVWGDVHVDGKVNIDDVFYLLGAWGECDGCCLGDLNVDGVVDIDDIFAMLTHWGSCP